MGLLLGGLGLWYALRSRRLVVGGTIVAAGLAWTATAMLVVIPHFSGGPSPFYSHYSSVGGSPRGILTTALHDPGAIFSAAFTGNDVLFLCLSFLPLLCLFVFAPTLSLLMAPQLALCLLSDRSADLSVNSNIFSPVIGFVIPATIFGIARFRHSERLVTLVLVSTLLSQFIGPLSSAGALAPSLDAHSRAAAAAVSLIPLNAPVTATNDLGSQLSARRQIYSFPQTTRADWVAVDLNDRQLPTINPGDTRVGLAVPRNDLVESPRRFQREVARLLSDPSWKLVFNRSDILVLQRRGRAR
jgi:hypothetical protein